MSAQEQLTDRRYMTEVLLLRRKTPSQTTGTWSTIDLIAIFMLKIKYNFHRIKLIRETSFIVIPYENDLF